MPNINREDNGTKPEVKFEIVPSECIESQNVSDNPDKDAVKKPRRAANPDKDLRSNTENPKFARRRLCGGFIAAIFVSLWGYLIFWAFCNSVKYCDSIFKTEIFILPCNAEKNAEYKLYEHMAKFKELTSLYGRYFNVSDDKIYSTLQDPYLWIVVDQMIGKENMTELEENYTDARSMRRHRPYKEDRLTIFSSFLSQPWSIEFMIGPNPPNMSTISGVGINQYYLDKKRYKWRLLPHRRLSVDNNYSLLDKVEVGPKFEQISQNSQITLTTQSSVDRLESFVFSASKWTGPISLAVFVDGNDEYCAFRQYVQYLKTCEEDIYNRTLFSLGGRRFNGLKFVKFCNINVTSCPFIGNLTDVLGPKNASASPGPGYPQNTMRNLARHNIATPYHLMLDIDIIPSAKMSESLNKFLENKPVFRNGLVIPTYEVSIKAKFPANKAELVNLRREGQAQPFHKEVFLLNQNATDFTRWEKIHDTFGDVTTAYEIEKYPLYYEPFFVEHQSGPLYNESFIGYGFTRSSHALESYVKNGNFLVLSPVFTVQLGLQKVKKWSPERQKQNANNRFLFQQFVTNLNNKTHLDWELSELH